MTRRVKDGELEVAIDKLAAVVPCGYLLATTNIANLLVEAAEAISMRDRQILELRGALQDVRLHLHAAGRRPQECYEMSVIDNALGERE